MTLVKVSDRDRDEVVDIISSSDYTLVECNWYNDTLHTEKELEDLILETKKELKKMIDDVVYGDNFRNIEDKIVVLKEMQEAYYYVDSGVEILNEGIFSFLNDEYRLLDEDEIIEDGYIINKND